MCTCIRGIHNHSVSMQLYLHYQSYYGETHNKTGNEDLGPQWPHILTGHTQNEGVRTYIRASVAVRTLTIGTILIGGSHTSLTVQVPFNQCILNTCIYTEYMCPLQIKLISYLF